MGKKMYYTEAEAAEKLGGSEQLNQHVEQGDLHAYPDGENRMFKVADVDALAGGGEDTSTIELSPADTAAPSSDQSADQASLSQADESGREPGSKADTVITSEGISIFDEEDLEIETADPMAKTQVAPSVEDQVLLEGTGSGSGLLDLTRESDDTSLGAEVLEHIDMEGAIEGEEETAAAGAAGGFAPRPQAPAAPPRYVEVVDAGGGLFTGVGLACLIVALLSMIVTIAAVGGVVPPFVASLRENTIVLIVGGVVVAGIFGLAGWLLGKNIAARQEAMRRVGS
ncbi:MAG: helix-turn-helix domain-containing protein [Phycisphaerae bacterium]|nr:helix-turn-helix domain-containing protein [Phycisphaerae bacterium]